MRKLVKLSYSCNTASQPLSVASTLGNGTPTPIVSSSQYGPSGPTTFALGNGLTTVNSYDTRGLLNARWICAGSASANCLGGSSRYGMSLDWSGQRVLDSWDSVLNQSATYGYDDMNRLASRTITAGTPQNFTYTYDRWATVPPKPPGLPKPPELIHRPHDGNDGGGNAQ